MDLFDNSETFQLLQMHDFHYLHEAVFAFNALTLFAGQERDERRRQGLVDRLQLIFDTVELIQHRRLNPLNGFAAP